MMKDTLVDVKLSIIINGVEDNDNFDDLEVRYGTKIKHDEC